MCESCYLTDTISILESDNSYYQEENQQLKEAVDKWKSIAGGLALELLEVNENA